MRKTEQVKEAVKQEKEVVAKTNNEKKQEKFAQIVEELGVDPIMVCGGCLKEKVFCCCGRPTKYEQSIPGLMLEYFETRRQMIYIDKTYYKDGELKSETAKLIAEQFPMFQRFAHKIGVNKDTLSQRAKDKDKTEFSVAYSKCKDIQEAILVENGLSGTYVANIVAFMLKNNHGYKDKTEVDQTTKHSGKIIIKLPGDEEEDGEDIEEGASEQMERETED